MLILVFSFDNANHMMSNDLKKTKDKATCKCEKIIIISNLSYRECTSCHSFTFFIRTLVIFGRLQNMHPIFSAILKLLDFCLYFFDIVSDVLTTKLYFDNCHYNYLAISISILASSYIITVTFLIWQVHEKQKWHKALAYPFITTFIVFKKVLNKLPFGKCSCIDKTT